MLYSWECQVVDCKTITEVTRKVAEIDLAPLDGCGKCGSKVMQRVILPRENGVKGFLLTDKFGGHDSEYTKTRSRK